MPTPQRLPIVNSDDAVWGDILRQYLMKEHYNDDTDNSANGGHQKITVRAGTATAGTAPLKFTSGTLLSTPEAGAVEFNSDTLYFTITTGTVRKKIAMYDDSSGATGDLYYRNSGGTLNRLAIGATGQALRVNGGVPAWSSLDDTLATRTESANYSITTNDAVIFANPTTANITISLPAAAAPNTGYKFYIKRIDGTSYTVTVNVIGGGTIDGQTSFTIDQRYTAVMVVSDGSAWYIL